MYEYIVFPISINLSPREIEIFISFDIVMALCLFTKTDKSKEILVTLNHLWCIKNNLYDYYITGNYIQA